jgi:hypothetical protein
MAEDLKTLIPRTRRAIDGPRATDAAAPSTTLSDAQLLGLIADAVAEVVFYTGGVFGHQLVVTDRDATYNAPNAWAVDPELTEAEATVIVSTAALNHFFYVAQDLKVQEAIRDEGSEWSYSLSAQLLLERVRHLQRDRDQALELVEAQQAVSTVWVNLLHERDRYVAEAIEPCLGQPYYGYRELR